MRGWTTLSHPLGRALLGIGACSLATTPLFFLVFILNDLVDGIPLDISVNSVLSIEAQQFYYGWIMTSLVVLPTLILSALVIYLLGRRENDSWGRAIAAGSVVGCVALIVAISLFRGSAPAWDLPSLPQLATFLFVSAVLNALYWVIAVWPLRRNRALLRQNRAAAQAME